MHYFGENMHGTMNFCIKVKKIAGIVWKNACCNGRPIQVEAAHSIGNKVVCCRLSTSAVTIINFQSGAYNL